MTYKKLSLEKMSCLVLRISYLEWFFRDRQITVFIKIPKKPITFIDLANQICKDPYIEN